MKRGANRRKDRRRPKTVLRLPDLEQAKAAVLNSLSSLEAQRCYSHPGVVRRLAYEAADCAQRRPSRGNPTGARIEEARRAVGNLAERRAG
jgi:hypothetical protein